MRESRTYGSVRGACDETHVPTATAARVMSAHGTSVWTGRALQVGYDGLEIVGLAHLYSAL
jgi:hypothetical protein